MKSYEVEDIKTFMNELLINDKFDSFYMYESRIKTKLDYYISGKVNLEFFEKDELELLEEPCEYTCWKDVKNLVFDLIKGKRLPISFKVILMFNRDNIERLLKMNDISMEVTNVGALFYNIYYEKGKLSITTGTSLKTFTMDKSIEHIWDETVEKYYI